jgi:hypothetical protein
MTRQHLPVFKVRNVHVCFHTCNTLSHISHKKTIFMMHQALWTTVTNLIKLGLTRNGVVNNLVQLPRNHTEAAIYWLLLLLTPLCMRGSAVNDAYCIARQLAHRRAILQSRTDFFIIGIILWNVLNKTSSSFSVSQVRYVLIITLWNKYSDTSANEWPC